MWRAAFTLVAALAVAIASATSAPAQPAAGVKSLAIHGAYSFAEAFDGNDVYWVSVRFDKKGEGGFDSVLYRQGFGDATPTELMRFPAADHQSFGSVFAQGGVVAVTIDGYGGFADDQTSSVIRMTRDGTGRQVIASGKVRSGGFSSSRKPPQADQCGTTVEAEQVTALGEIVISESTRERKAKQCGGSADVNRWRYYAVSGDGATRELARSQGAVRSKVRRLKGGGWSIATNEDSAGELSIELVGDYAVLRGQRKSKLRNLSTGAEFGPYRSSFPGGSGYASATTDGAGRVAVQSFLPYRTKTEKHGKGFSFVVYSHVRNQLFPTIGDSRNAVTLKGHGEVRFCGTGLYAVALNPNRTITQLDPVSGSVVRVLGSVPGAGGWDSCDSSHLYFQQAAKRKVVVRAVPLG